MSWQLVFADDFNRANSATVGNGWSQASDVSSRGINNNEIYLTSGTGNSSFWLWRPHNLSDDTRQRAELTYTATTRVGYNVADHVAVGFFQNSNRLDQNNGYLFYLHNTLGRIFRVTNSAVYTELAIRYNVGDAAGKRLLFERNGSQFIASIEGTSWQITATDSTHTNLPFTGIQMRASAGTNTNRADDFALYEFIPTETTAPIHLLRTQMIPAL